VFPGMAENLVPLHRWELLFERVSRFLRDPGREGAALDQMRGWAHENFAPAVIAEKQLQCYGVRPVLGMVRSGAVDNGGRV
jgi:hypothetical protein